MKGDTPTMRIVRGHRPEARVRVRSTSNGMILDLTSSAAAAMVAVGDAELIDELAGIALDEYERALAHVRAIPAVSRHLANGGE